uniref:Uncharacterized protein n=1 Tax=Plectus sambesii TaxID=2011161 RepID=A0A914V3Y4_9BILA
MGCAPSHRRTLFSRRKPDINNNDEPDEVDKVLIMESWTKLKKDRGYANIGTEIFYRILIQGVDYRKLWNLGGVEIADLRRHVILDTHGKVMRDELNRLLHIWSTPKNGNTLLVRSAHKLGADHYERLKKHRFSASMWQTFPSIMLEVMAPYCDNVPASHGKEEVLAAWWRFCVHLIYLLQRGWEESAKNDRAETRETNVEHAEDLW